jgi:hypothetical protein
MITGEVVLDLLPHGGGRCDPTSLPCPHMYSTDLTGFMCQRLEVAHLAYLRTLLGPAPSLIGRHTPDRAHEVEGPEGQLEYLKLVILLPPSGVNAGDPPPPRIVDAKVRHRAGARPARPARHHHR